MDEIWKSVVRNLNYEVSNFGRVRRAVRCKRSKAGKILKVLSNQRYGQVGLWTDGIAKKALVHILVMEAFVGPCPEGYEVNHKDTDRMNNHLENLEYCTPKENMEHASQNGLLLVGEENRSTKLTDEQVVWLRDQVASGKSRRSVAKELGISFQHAGDIVSRKKRKYL